MTTPLDRLHDHFITLSADPREDPPPEHEPVDLRPVSAYEAITRQMVESLGEELREIKGRLNGLIFMMLGAILLEFVSRMIPA